MFNTYGIRSINNETFNIKYHDGLYLNRPFRNVVITALRLYNAVMNILGYIPFVKLFSGCVRIGIGLAIIGITGALGERDAKEGFIIGRFYDEATAMGIAQVGRGILEAFVPFGFIVNAALDILATPINLSKEVQNSLVCQGCMMGGSSHLTPHPDVNYPFPFNLLHVV